MIKYVALLRGINVGGHRPVRMVELKKTFESLGFQNVKTLLASGNVLFETPKKSTDMLVKQIQEKLEHELGHEVGVVLRTMEEIQNLVDVNPFKNIEMTQQTRLYVTFLPEKQERAVIIPHESTGRDFRILHISASEVYSVVILSQDRGTTDLMSFLEKEFGRKVTTRNWNTIARILKG